MRYLKISLLLLMGSASCTMQAQLKYNRNIIYPFGNTYINLDNLKEIPLGGLI